MIPQREACIRHPSEDTAGACGSPTFAARRGKQSLSHCFTSYLALGKSREKVQKIQSNNKRKLMAGIPINNTLFFLSVCLSICFFLTHAFCKSFISKSSFYPVTEPSTTQSRIELLGTEYTLIIVIFC